jgi:predicted HTH domain antitoxin
MAVQTLAFADEWLVAELPRLYRERPDLVYPLLHSLLNASEELRWSLVVRAYQDQEINLGKAADLLGLHELELRDRFVELGIPLRQGSADFAEARAEVEAVRAWYCQAAEAWRT